MRTASMRLWRTDSTRIEKPSAVMVSPRRGRRPSSAKTKPPDGVVGVGVHRQLDAVVGQVAHGDVPAHEPLPAGQPPDLPGHRVGLIGDLPHDLLDDVLDRDDAHDAAVLVHHHGHRGALALQVREQIVERLGLGHDRRVVHDRPHGGVWPLLHQALRERTGMHEAAYAVAVVFLGHHQARVAARYAQLQGGLHVLGDVDRDHRGDRRHHLARVLLVQVKDAAEHARLAGIQMPAGVGLGDQALELLLAAAAPACLACRRRATARSSRIRPSATR